VDPRRSWLENKIGETKMRELIKSTIDREIADTNSFLDLLGKISSAETSAEFEQELKK